MTREKKIPIKRQIFYLRKILTNKDIHVTKSELRDYMDETLHYDENKAIVLKHFVAKPTKYDETVNQEILEDFIIQAERRDADRSTRSRMMDYHIKALKTYTPRQMANNPELADKWFKDPNQTDIKGIDVSKDAKTVKQKQKDKNKEGKKPGVGDPASTSPSSIDSIELKERTIGILGQKGTGKTFLTRALINSFKDHCVIYDTIGAFKKEKLNAQNFEVVPNDLEKQAIAWGVISSKTSKNVAVDLSRLTRKEIITFTDIALKTAEYKDKNIFIDEIADYLPEQASKSEEMERLIRHGRNEGDTFFFNTQRPAQISKNTLNLVDILIVFRLVWNRDIEVLEELFNSLAIKNITGEIQKITNQGVGEYQLYSFHN